jgi:hypothetical protein
MWRAHPCLALKDAQGTSPPREKLTGIHVLCSNRRLSDSPSVKKESELPRRGNPASSNPPAEVDPDTVLRALFKSSGASVTTQPTEFKIKL